MPYQLLTEDKVVPYLAALPGLGRIFNSFEDIEVREIGDGNLNFVYFVTDRLRERCSRMLPGV